MTIFDSLTDLDALADGRLVLTGLDASELPKVCRMNVDGSLDDSFGDAGCATLGTTKGYGTDVLLDETGLFLIASIDRKIAIARFHHDGTPDLGFGSSGVVFHGAPDAFERPFNARLFEDGIALLAFYNDGVHQTMTLRRFDLDGSPTASFGTNGRIELGYGWGGGLERRPNGGFVTGGQSLLFLTASGEIDTSVGGGVVETPERVVGLALRGDDVFAADTELNVYRCSSDGTLEHEYGGLGPLWQAASDLTFEEDGTLLVFGGGGGNGYFPHFFLARRTPSGALDESFSSGGLHSYLGGPSPGHLAVLRDGRYVLSGTNRTPDYIYSGVLLRVWD